MAKDRRYTLSGVSIHTMRRLALEFCATRGRYFTNPPSNKVINKTIAELKGLTNPDTKNMGFAQLVLSGVPVTPKPKATKSKAAYKPL